MATVDLSGHSPEELADRYAACVAKPANTCCSCATCAAICEELYGRFLIPNRAADHPVQRAKHNALTRFFEDPSLWIERKARTARKPMIDKPVAIATSGRPVVNRGDFEKWINSRSRRNELSEIKDSVGQGITEAPGEKQSLKSCEKTARRGALNRVQAGGLQLPGKGGEVPRFHLDERHNKSKSPKKWRNLEWIDQQINNQPEPLKTALVLHYREGLSVTSIAARTGVSRTTMQSRLQKFLADCKARIERGEHETGEDRLDELFASDDNSGATTTPEQVRLDQLFRLDGPQREIKPNVFSKTHDLSSSLRRSKWQ